MTGEHPWIEWLYILIVFAVAVGLVWGIVRLMLWWAHKQDDSGKPKS
jgi:hypothetical protein